MRCEHFPFPSVRETGLGLGLGYMGVLTLDFRRTEGSHALVVELLHFCFLGGGEGEGVAEVVFWFGCC